MENLLRTQFITYLSSRKKHLEPINLDLQVRIEETTSGYFDIIDRAESIVVAMGKGSATYHNPDHKQVCFLDYEAFVNALPPEYQKNIKKADFIAWHQNGYDFFIINELSQSGNRNNKISDARQQLHKTAFYLMNVAEIKALIATYERKECIFSNKHKQIPTPDDMAQAFYSIQEYLPDPVVHNFQPITKLGFTLIETAVIEL